MPPPPGVSDPDLWIMDLPPAKETSAGSLAGFRVSADGTTESVRDNEDRYYTCRFESLQLYVVLDGHNGSRACEFARKKIPSVLLQRDVGTNGERAADALRYTFDQTERHFFLMLDQYITRKMVLQMEIQAKGGTTSLLAYSMFPEKVEELQRLEEQISGGTTAVVSLIHNNRYLWVANVGDSRAVLCYLDGEGKLHAEQISEDHNTKNAKEIARLEACGLDGIRLISSGRLGVHQNTRSIGDYSIKGGYKDHDILSTATREPGIAEPFISNPPIDITSVRGFLLLMSDGLYDAHAAVTKSPQTVNHDLALLVQRHLDFVSSLDEVADKVIAEVSSNFKKAVTRNHESARMDDITLIIHNLGYPLGQITRNLSAPAAKTSDHRYENSPLLSPQHLKSTVSVSDGDERVKAYSVPSEIPGERGMSGYVTGGFSSAQHGATITGHPSTAAAIHYHPPVYSSPDVPVGAGGDWQHTSTTQHIPSHQHHHPTGQAVYENWELGRREREPHATRHHGVETTTPEELGAEFNPMNVGSPQQMGMAMRTGSWQMAATNADPQFQPQHQHHPGQPSLGGAYTNAALQQTGVAENVIRVPVVSGGESRSEKELKRSSTQDSDAVWMYDQDVPPTVPEQKTVEETGQTTTQREEETAQFDAAPAEPESQDTGEGGEEGDNGQQAGEATDVAELEITPDSTDAQNVTSRENEKGMIEPIVKFDKFPSDLSWDEI